MSDINYSEVCDQCTGHCCKHMIMYVTPGTEMRKLLGAHFGRKTVDRAKLHIYHRCVHLTDDNKCDIWDSDERPDFCKKWVCEEAKSDLVELNAVIVDNPMKAFLDEL